MANRTVSVDLVANVGQYQSAMVRAASTTKVVGDNAAASGMKAQRGFEAAGRGATILGTVLAGGVALGLKRTIDLAANAEQSVGGVEAVFKGYAQSVIASSEAADRALGLSANSYRELATVIGSQLKNAGVPMEQLAVKTDELITMGADLAAMFGGTTEEAVRALSSALKGEMDPIEAYGISLNDAALKAEAAALGLEVLGGSLTTNQRAMAVMSLVTKQGADAVGAFGRESDTAAGRAARASAQWENLQTAIGEKLLPVWSALMDFVGETVIPGLETVGGVIADVTSFMLENKEVAAGLAAVLLVQLVGGLGAIRVAVNRLVLTNVVLGLSNMLGVVLDLPGALGKATGAISGFVSAAAPLVAVGAVVYAIGKVVDFATAADDAREEVEGMWDAVGEAPPGERLGALTAMAEDLEVKIRGLRLEIEDIGLGLDTPLRIFEGGAADLETLEQYELALAQVKAQIDDTTPGFFGLEGALEAVGVSATASSQQSQEAIDEWLGKVAESNDTFAGALSTYQGLLDQKTQAAQEQAQAEADATESASDSWEDHVDSVEVSLGELAAALQTNIDNQMNWRTNLGQIAQWAGQDVANHLMEMGADGVDIVAAMADGTSAEAQAMREQIVRQIALTSDQGTAEFGSYMRIMETMGKEGGARTVQGLAAALGLGVEEVRRIAALYGLNLAEGVNPLLAALGKPRVEPAINGQRQYYYAEGGYTGDGGKWDPAGIVHKGEYVVSKERTARLGVRNLENLERIMPGYADGGYVNGSSVPRPPSVAPYTWAVGEPGKATMDRAYGDTVDWVDANTAPPIAAGSPGQWQAMFAAVQRQFPGVVLHSGFRPGSITATGNLSYHASGRAIDITPSMDIFNWLASNYGSSRELIFSPAGTRQIWNGSPHYYSEPTRSDHFDHIHWAMKNGGVIDEPVIGRGMWSGGSYSFGEAGPETVLPGIRSREFGAGGGAGGGYGPSNVVVNARVFVGNREITDIARVEATAVVNGAVTGANRRLSAAGVR